MFRWYVVNTYSGHENKVKHNLEHRIVSLGQQRAVRNVVVPTEAVAEMKDNQKVTVEKRTMPGYVLVNMELNEDSWGVVKGTPGVTGFVGASQEPVALTQGEVDRRCTRRSPRPRTRARSSRSASPSRSSPARSRTSPARSPRSTRTPPGSRCWYQSSVERPL
jgi:transcriptional antiterminator NusG